MQVDNSVPYSARRVYKAAAHGARATADLADLYVCGLAALKPATTGLPWVTAGMAVGHGLFAVSRLFAAGSENATAYTRQKNLTWAFGEGLQTAGYALLAMGQGVWALPIVATGAVISNFAYFQ
ncbi:MAG: hypothetical protein AB1758_04985 [Candidatus Eremiobacterota bacterium]